MDKIIDKIMSFINENTTLLIIICVFLIFVLIAYLIDNSIKTKKLAKMQEKELAKESVVTETKVEEIKPVENNSIEATPTIETPVEIVPEETKVEENNDINDYPTIDDTGVEKEETIEPIEGTSNELVVDPVINDILLKDFTKNDTIQEIEEIEDDDLTLTPINNISKIEETEEIVLPSPEIKVESKEQKKSLYKNDKKLSDIFTKKKEDIKEEELLNTQSLENELDRILSKLNTDERVSETKDSTLEETVDFTNMF